MPKAKTKVYYKPSCITCKRAISKLKSENVQFNLHDFFKDRLNKEELRPLLRKGNLSARDILRKKDKMYKELKFDERNYTEDQILTLIVKHPGLLLSPIIVRDNTVIVGNKAERIDEFCRGYEK